MDPKRRSRLVASTIAILGSGLIVRGISSWYIMNPFIVVAMPKVFDPSNVSNGVVYGKVAVLNMRAAPLSLVSHSVGCSQEERGSVRLPRFSLRWIDAEFRFDPKGNAFASRIESAEVDERHRVLLRVPGSQSIGG